MARHLIGVKRTILMSACLALFLPFIVVAFEWFIFSPIHEYGHVLACQALGVHVVRAERAYVEWWSASADWRENIIGFMGGFVAALVLCLIYVPVTIVFNRLGKLTAPHRRLHRLIRGSSALVKAGVMVDILTQAMAALLEGSSNSVYRQVISMPFIYVVTWAFSWLCLFWQLRKLTLKP
jgi:hypothetical protein